MSRICVFAPNALPVLAESCETGFGGAEVKLVEMARVLIDGGHHVTFVTYSGDRYEEHSYQGIDVVNLPVKQRSWGTFYRSVGPLVKELWKVDADYYVQRAAGAATGIVALAAALRGSRFVYFVASSYDVDGGYLRETGVRNRMLYRWGIDYAHRVVVQTEEFGASLLETFGRTSVQINDGHAIPDRVPPFSDRRFVLFMGGIRPVKQPEVFLELARRCPDLTFKMVGGPLVDHAYFDRIRRSAAGIANVELVGHVPRSEVGAYLQSAYALVNTSEREGLPNTVTEAWSWGTPVVGLEIDPQGLLSGRLGFTCSGEMERLTSHTRCLVESPVQWTEISARCRQYAAAHHDIEGLAEEYRTLFELD